MCRDAFAPRQNEDGYVSSVRRMSVNDLKQFNASQTKLVLGSRGVARTYYESALNTGPTRMSFMSNMYKNVPSIAHPHSYSGDLLSPVIWDRLGRCFHFHFNGTPLPTNRHASLKGVCSARYRFVIRVFFGAERTSLQVGFEHEATYAKAKIAMTPAIAKAIGALVAAAPVTWAGAEVLGVVV